MKKGKKEKIIKLLNDKKSSIFFFLFCLSILFISVGYSSLNEELNISSEVKFEVKKDIRIKDVKLYETTNLALENYENKFSKDNITLGIDLKDLKSTISYKVIVENKGTVAMWIDDILSVAIDDNIEFIVDDNTIKNIIYPAEKKEFTITLKYKDSTNTLNNTIYNCHLKLNFKKPESTLATGEKVDQTSAFFNGKIAREKIERIEFLPTLDVVEGAIGYWDASLEQNGTVIASYLDTDKNGLYELYIGGIGKVNAPSNSAYLFRYFTNLTKIDFNKYFNTSNATNMRGMFSNCNILTKLDLSNFDTSNVEDMSGMFQLCKTLTNLNISTFNTSNVTNMSIMFSNCNILTKLDLSNFDTSNVEDMSGMFQLCETLTNLNISTFNTSKVTLMNHLFNKCNSIKNIDLSHFDTSNVTNMRAMFQKCYELVDLNISSFNTPNLTDMQNMFSECNKLRTIDVSRFDTSKVTNMRALFQSCFELTNVDLSHFNTSKVVDMRNMFFECHNLTSLDLSKFNTPNVADMQCMFYNCTSLINLDISSFNTANVTNMSAMFQGLPLKKMDLSHFDTSNVISTEDMFNNCTNLMDLNISSFDFSNVTASSRMFSNVPINSSIYVKDDISKEFILGVRSDLSNVQIKQA